MRSESNLIPAKRVARAPSTRFMVLGAGVAIALNRAEDGLPAGAKIGVCYALLGETLATELELIPAGHFGGRDGRSWNNDQPDQVVALSQAIQIPAGICIDEDHALEFSANEKIGGSAPAYGWIKSLEIREGAIWGKVEWTPLGAQAVKDRIYCGLSPVFAFDEDSGRVLALLSAGLTNKPNLTLKAFNSRERHAVQQEKVEMKKIAELLGLKPDASESDIQTALNAVLAVIGALAAAIGVDAKAAIALNAESMNAALTKKFGAPNAVLVALCTKAEVKTDAAADAIIAGLEKVLIDPAKFVPMDAHMALKEELTALNAGKPAELVKQALKDGRLLPRQESWALNYAQRDLEGFKTYIGVAPEQLGDVRKPTDKALNASDSKAIATAAQAYIAEQSKLGITVSATAAVNHVTKQGA